MNLPFTKKKMQQDIDIIFVLVNPSPERARELYDISGIPHIGLAYVAGSLEEDGFKVHVIDSKMGNYSSNDILQIIGEIYNNDLRLSIGFTAFTHEIERASELATIIKESFPSSHIFIGGVHCTVLPEETLEEFPVFEFAVVGEAEETIVEVANTLKRGEDLNTVPGLVVRKDGRPVLTEKRSLPDVTNLPRTAYHLFPKSNIYYINTARGCPFNCYFCTRISGKKVRARDPGDVVDEMVWLKETFNPDIVSFTDETFTVNKERVEKLLEIMTNKGLHKSVRWYATTRVDTVSYSILKKMKQAGCKMLGIGVESGNDEILQKIGKILINHKF